MILKPEEVSPVKRMSVKRRGAVSVEPLVSDMLPTNLSCAGFDGQLQ